MKRFRELYLVHFQRPTSTTTIRTGSSIGLNRSYPYFSTSAQNSPASSPLRPPAALVTEPTQMPPHDLKIPISHPPPQPHKHCPRLNSLAPKSHHPPSCTPVSPNPPPPPNRSTQTAANSPATASSSYARPLAFRPRRRRSCQGEGVPKVHVQWRSHEVDVRGARGNRACS